MVVEDFRLILTTETELGVYATDLLFLLLLLLLLDSSLLLPSFVSLRSLITETRKRTNTVPRLRSQNGLGQKWFLLCQQSHAWFSFSGMLYPVCLQLGHLDNGAEKVDEGRILREIWLGGLGIGIRKEVVFKNV